MAGVDVALGGLGRLGVGAEEGKGIPLLLTQVDTAAVGLRDQQVPNQLQLTLLKTSRRHESVQGKCCELLSYLLEATFIKRYNTIRLS